VPRSLIFSSHGTNDPNYPLSPPTTSPHSGSSLTQNYPGGASSYGQNAYHSSVPVTASSTVPQPLNPLYGDNSTDDPRFIQSAYPPPYYTKYPSSLPTTDPQSYSPISPTSPINYAQAFPGHLISRPQSEIPQSAYSRSQSYLYSYPQYTHSSHSGLNYSSQSPTWPSHSMHPIQERPRTVPLPYLGSPPPISYPAPPQPNHTEVGSSSNRLLSWVRSFSCDLCSLSFNRQHDLKRHRETHTGKKPYLCNGGCGKTFTRKDALKRHQLVKSCGKIDE